jgi:hypothetical protein
VTFLSWQIQGRLYISCYIYQIAAQGCVVNEENAFKSELTLGDALNCTLVGLQEKKLIVMEME